MEGFLGEERVFDCGETDFKDILDSDVFHNVPMTDHLEGISSSSSYYEYDYLFDDDPLLSDKIVCGDAPSSPSPQITTEHSYSMISEPSSPLMKDIKQEDDLDSNFDSDGLDEMLPVSPENDHHLPLLGGDHHGDSSPAPRYILTTDTLSGSQPILTATANASALARGSLADFNLPGLSTTTLQHKHDGSKQIKLELVTTMLAVDSGLDSKLQLPPTPPGSTASDSDGGESPQRSGSSAPSSPRALHTQPAKKPICHTRTVSPQLFTNIQKLPQSGPLILTEEEKRTLKQEGYPIPTKLPLTKAEEKSLKKVRRKIKNKISAQESRRKKKEYLEALEKRMDSYTHENTELRKKVESLETTNQSLLTQLTKLQSIVNKVTKPIKASSTQTGTCLMVLVLCFAVFLGSWTPHSFLSSRQHLPKLFSSAPAFPNNEIPHPFFGPFGDDQYSASASASGNHDDPNHNADEDPYTTYSMRSSRTLLSYQEEEEVLASLGLRYHDNEDEAALLADIAPDISSLTGAKMAAMLGGQGPDAAGLESDEEANYDAYMHPDMEAKIIPVDTMALINRSSNK
ncbi:cyclic AMP-responsive element-binding protein 3-like protein 1 [Diadema antillarum]|uniref:cyclic AMP-responsive element-binding protein 3-like protein 1 n=1 Tax=Diadema antillarum TaxID=105358 RepID=UPI003A8ACAC1